MNELEKVHEQLNMLIKLQKACIKSVQTIFDYISNVSVGTDKKLQEIEKKIECLKVDISRIDKLIEEPKHEIVYTPKTLYEMKQKLSWNKLHERTGIPISTLQYRCKRYVEKELDSLELEE